MIAIIIEGVLLVVLVTTFGALFFVVLRDYTPLGKRLRQKANRKRIERAVALTCPNHGAQREEDLVRLSSGETVCPQCFKETVWQVR